MLSYVEDLEDKLKSSEEYGKYAFHAYLELEKSMTLVSERIQV